LALSSTVRTFDIELSDIDRGVYDSLSLKVAQHPSESLPYLVARVVAYALEHTEGLVFTTGLSTADEPALWVRDLTDRLEAWIEVGTPAPARLHKASKAADRVAVYCHKAPDAWLRQLASERVHQADQIALYALDPQIITAIGDTVGRRNRWQLTRTEGTVYLDGEASFELPVRPMGWPSA
jgi:uncharacterized protein YaeQ